MTSLGRQCWPDIEGSATTTLLVPLGSTEQHGPHLPLDTDTRIAVAIAEGAAGSGGVIVAPPLTYGASGEHQGFPGTISIGTEALADLLVELGRSALESFQRVVLVNGHGGNLRAVTAATGRLRAEGRAVDCWSPRIADGDAHAGTTETSLLLAIDPAAVRMDRAEPGTDRPLAEMMSDLERDGLRAHAPNGVLGDPTTASAERGAELLDRLVADLSRLVRGD